MDDTPNKPTSFVKYEEYSTHYTEKTFWAKIVKHYKTIGKKMLEIILELYYAYRDENTPKWAKRIIIGSLGYLIFPLDLVPDFILHIGYTDDITTLLLALSAVALYIKPEHKRKATDKVSLFFDKFDKKIKQ